MSALAVPQEVQDFVMSDAGSLVREDLPVWLDRYKTLVTVTSAADAPLELLAQLFAKFPEFRTLLDHRIRHSGKFAPDYRYLTQHRRGTETHLNVPKLGGGCFIQHGTGTWIYAQSIGRNFFVNQNVTVGQGRKWGSPTIGDNVQIRTGAVVVGPIRIGNDVFIGANAVVHFDLPDGAQVYPPRSVVVLREERSAKA